jgi:polysaccharide biosynthesis/export protein
MRILWVLLCAVSLQACTKTATYEETPPTANPGGVGVTLEDQLIDGPEAVSSISKLPSANEVGSVLPFASQGQASAYEFATGYRVGSGDRLSVKVVGEAELTGEYVVDPSGVMSMPYVRSVPVAGMTTGDIERLVVHKLKDGYLRDPKVSVQVVNLRPFYIMGEVGAAGSYPYQGGITVQNAIAIAGGYGPRADQTTVMLTRRNGLGTKTYHVPITTTIYPGDVVFVRERWF